MAAEPNHGAAGAASAEEAAAAAGTPGGGEPGAGQGATGEGEHSAGPTASGSAPGESPLSAAAESDPFAERPEAYVGAAFAGGFALALLLKRLAR
jgi:hypothetical protein